MTGQVNNKKSVTKLTPEQDNFYRLLRLRATSKRFGQPYIAHVIFRLVPISAPGLKTMGVDDHYRVYIDFDYMMEKGVEHASQILNHEPWHLLRKHGERSKAIKNVNHKAWNLAGDAELNDDIKGLVPKESIFPSTFNLPEEKMAEFYYNKIMEEAKKRKEERDKQKEKNKDKDKGDKDKGEKGKPQQPGPGEPGENGEPGEGGKGGKQDPNGTPQPGKNGTPGENGEPTDEEGQLSNGAGNLLDDLLPDNPMCGNGDEEFDKDYKLEEGDADSVSDFDQELISQQVAGEIKEAAQRDPGSVPASHRIWADEKLAKTPTPWQKILRGAVKSALSWQKGKVDYVKSKPNRRQPVKGVIYPALMAPKAKILIGVDTSGSHVPMLGRVLDEVNTIMASSGVKGKELRLFSIDTQMKEKPKFVNDAKKVNFNGGGGTAMRPAFDYSKKDKKNHDVFILFTDGELPQGDYPKVQPSSGVRYIICILGWEGDSYLNQSYERAKNEAGAWAKIVKIAVPRDDR